MGLPHDVLLKFSQCEETCICPSGAYMSGRCDVAVLLNISVLCSTARDVWCGGRGTTTGHVTAKKSARVKKNNVVLYNQCQCRLL